MYPFFGMLREFIRIRSLPPISPLEVHINHVRVMPWDIDPFLELNNGRALTLYDLGRFPYGKRVGLVDVLKREKWALTMAGVYVRYRRRVKACEKVEVRSRTLCWDERFIYLDQTMWKKNGDCASQAVYRVAVATRDGLVRPAEVMKAMDLDLPSPPVPSWIQAWIDAESQRPWPPAKE